MAQEMTFKIQKTQGSAFQKYQDLVVGSRSLWFLVKFELVTFLFGNFPGAMGLLLRKWTYPWILGRVGRGVVFGHHVSLRHSRKIFIGNDVVIDEGCLLDAKGSGNQGIRIGDGVFIGRQAIIYCKGGDIVLEDRVNVGHRSIIFSSNHLCIGRGTLLAADCYVMSGGSYDYRSNVPFVDQDGTISKGPLNIGANCWLGAKAIVLDGALIGKNSVIGAGSVVTQAIPAGSVAVGVPAKVMKKR